VGGDDDLVMWPLTPEAAAAGLSRGSESASDSFGTATDSLRLSAAVPP
jgi:hypothetical protein